MRKLPFILLFLVLFFFGNFTQAFATSKVQEFYPTSVDPDYHKKATYVYQLSSNVTSVKITQYKPNLSMIDANIFSQEVWSVTGGTYLYIDRNCGGTVGLDFYDSNNTRVYQHSLGNTTVYFPDTNLCGKPTPSNYVLATAKWEDVADGSGGTGSRPFNSILSSNMGSPTPPPPPPPPPESDPNLDSDGDGIPNVYDYDMDNDGIDDMYDTDINGNGVPNTDDPDMDGDSTPNTTDPDIDGDKQLNQNDSDMDGDGLPNTSDPDIDGDGIPNASDPDFSNGGSNDISNAVDSGSTTMKIGYTGSTAVKDAVDALAPVLQDIKDSTNVSGQKLDSVLSSLDGVKSSLDQTNIKLTELILFLNLFWGS